MYTASFVTTFATYTNRICICVKYFAGLFVSNYYIAIYIIGSGSFWTRMLLSVDKIRNTVFFGKSIE